MPSQAQVILEQKHNLVENLKEITEHKHDDKSPI
jgi:hypothetical protein